MATLSGENMTDVAEETATANVTSDSTEGTLYVAVRTGSAYTTGDEQIIKDGTGAEWSGSAVPQLGPNSFSVTGLTASTDYHCGFVQEEPDVGAPVPNWEWDFTTTTQKGTEWTSGGSDVVWYWDSNGHVKSTDTSQDNYVYSAGVHDGSLFAPPSNGWIWNVDVINTLLHNGGDVNDYRDHWSDGNSGNDINLEDPVQHGEVYFLRCEYKTNAPAQPYISARRDGESYAGPWAWVAYVKQGNAPGCTLEFDDTRGYVTFNWEPDGSLTVEEYHWASQYAMTYEVYPGIWAISIGNMAASTQFKVLHFYPDKRTNAPVAGNYTHFFAGSLYDGIGTYDYVPSPVGATPLSLSKTAPRFALDHPDGINGSVTFAVRVRLPLYTINRSATLSGLYGNWNNRLLIVNVDQDVPKLKLTLKTGDLQIETSAPTEIWEPGVNLVVARARLEPTETILDLWMNGVKVGTATGAQTAWINSFPDWYWNDFYAPNRIIPAEHRDIRVWYSALTDEQCEALT